MKPDDLIVSKTDIKGKLTYCNSTFISFSGYSERELLGQPHKIVRHPDMPRTVFQLLWQTIASGEEFFGYVKNLCKNGSYYWVFATITPSFRPGGQEIIGYFSVRRKPDANKLRRITALYQNILDAEAQTERSQSILQGQAVLQQALTESGKNYREFILTL